MDFTYWGTEQAAEVGDRARAFMDEVVLPVEREQPGGEPVTDAVIDQLREQAREYEVYCPQIDETYGGMGLDFQDVVGVYEEAGRSLLGPPAMRVDAPDEGNMHILERAGTERQKNEWLQPLVDGDAVSAFSMTEPMPGAGSDPKMLKTTAEKDGDTWVIDGHKWWTSQGQSADVFLVMARTDPDAHPYQGCSLFLVPADTDGIEIIRDIPAMGGDLLEIGHAEIRYDGVRVPDANLVGGENTGFTVAQQRLGPARLTHCLRFCGMAERSLSVAQSYAAQREAFESTLADKQAIRHAIADAETQLHAARTITRHAVRLVAAGEQARIEVAMAKNFTANAIQDIVDTAVQICGGAGISRDLPLADFYESLRFFRIGDGPDEVHKRTIAREAFTEINEQELESLTRYASH